MKTCDCDQLHGFGKNVTRRSEGGGASRSRYIEWIRVWSMASLGLGCGSGLGSGSQFGFRFRVRVRVKVRARAGASAYLILSARKCLLNNKDFR